MRTALRHISQLARRSAIVIRTRSMSSQAASNGTQAHVAAASTAAASAPSTATGAHGTQQKPPQSRAPKQPRQPKSEVPAADAASANGSAPDAAAAAAAATTPAADQQPRAPRVKQPKQPKPAANAAAAASARPPAGSSSTAVPARPSMPSVLAHPSFGSVQLVDIGANLTDDMFEGSYHGKKQHQPDLDLVLQRAYERGVRKVIVTAGSAKESVNVQNLITRLEAEAVAKSVQFPLLYSTVGVHPTRSKEWEGNEKHQASYFDRLLRSILDGLGMTAVPGASSASSFAAATASVAPRPRQVVVSIGECGLDYDRLHFSDRETQLRHFAKHFTLVERVVEMTQSRPGGSVHLPLFLHDRNTRGDFLQILRDNRSRFRDGVVHSFTGSIEDLQALLALDLHIGINGCSLKTEANLAVLDHIPLNRLMLETDAPWCDIRATHASASLVGTRFGEGDLLQARSPDKWSASLKGGVKGRNEPGNMVQVLEVVAARLGMDPVELAAVVWRNTQRVFFPSEFAAAEAAAPASAASAVESK